MKKEKTTFEMLKESDFYVEGMVFKFNFYSEGEIHYKHVDVLGEFYIQISFMVDSIFSCHEEHELDWFEDDDVKCFNYKVYVTTHNEKEGTSDYSYNFEQNELSKQ